jgi:cell division septation protein DedD
MREGELFKEKIEVSLDGRQVFCLFCGGAVIACLVFVLGVMVGRRVEARVHPDRMAAGAVASDPLAALDQLAADDTSGLAFASALRGEGAGDPLGSVDETIAAMAVEIAPEPPSADKTPPAPEPAPEPAPKPKPESKPESKPGSESQSGSESRSGSASRSGSESGSGPADQARFTLQLSSFQDRAEADAFLADLRKAGYKPFLVEAEVDGKGTWYRVRLGQYPTYDAALAGKEDFESKQKIIAYVTRLR